MLQLKLNNSDISASIDWTSLVKTEVLTKEVDRLEFNIKKTASKTIPSLNDTIELYEDGVKIFGGLLVERNEKNLGGLLIGYECKCKDWSAKLDGKVVTKKYANQDPHAIVLDIIAKFAPAGFTTANVKTAGFNVKSIKFNYEQVSRSLTQLADQIGWDWYVDPDKDIHFFDEETALAPFNLDDTSGNFEWATLQLNQTVVNLKNSVFVRGGDYKKTISAGSAIDIFKGDGTQVMFPLAYKYDNITVEKNGSSQSVGTDQQTDPGTVQTLYNFTEKFVRFTTAPANGDTVKVYGDAYIPIIAHVRDQLSIAAYGEVQVAIIDKAIESITEAQSRAKAELDKYAETVNEGRLKTIKTGLKTGQRITLSSAIRNINKQFKITRIIGKARGSDHLEYEIFLLASGEVSFTDIMVDLLGRDKKNVEIADNEVLERLESFFEDIQFNETTTPSKKSPPYTWGVGGSNDFRWDFATWA